MEDPRVLKLRNGEMIIATIEETTDDDIVKISNVISVVPHQVMQGEMVGETFLLKPWIGITEDRYFFIAKDNILTVCSLRENLVKQYKSYLAPQEEIPQPRDQFDIEDMVEANVLRSKNLLNQITS